LTGCPFLSSFTEEQQGEISGLSRSVSNLGSSLGTAIAGTIVIAHLSIGSYGAAMITLAAIGLMALIAALALPRGTAASTASTAPGEDG
jgi:predicted MFS family arabinose efflux permease